MNSLKRILEPTAQQNNAKKQKILFKGMADPRYRVNYDPWGYSFTLRKSDMQKAIRRGLVKEALVAFFALYNMAVLFPENPNGKREQTNIINRIAICAMEDIGVANVPLVLYVVRVCTGMTQRQQPRCAEVLEKIIVALCESKKTRVQSWMTHAYNGKNRDISEKYGLVLTCPPTDTLADPNWFNYVEMNQIRVWEKLGYNPNMKSIKYQPFLYQVYKKIAERNKRAVTQFALAVAHFKATGVLEKDTQPVSNLDYIVVPYTNPRFNLEESPPQQCAYDMHVNKPKSREEKVRFRTEGSTVINEDAQFKSPVLYRIYSESLL